MANETEPIEQNEAPSVRLDTPSMETRTSHYPEALREPVLWLASFCREECSGDIDALTTRAEKLGLSIDKTNWSKILRGKWNRDAGNKTLKTPIVNIDRLLRAVETLRKDSRNKERFGKIPFVRTTVAQQIFDFIDEHRAPDRVNKFGMLVGRTGTQKTASIDEYCLLNNHLTCIKVDAPARPSLAQFVDDLAKKYGCVRTLGSCRKLNTVYESVNERRTIIVENVQRLYNTSFQGDQPVFNFLQKIQEDSGCTIILTLTPTFAAMLESKLQQGYFEQFIGRAGGVKSFCRLPDFAPEEDVQMIAESFGLKDAAKHLDYLVAISRETGLIRILFEALQKAKILAEAEREKITINHIRAARKED